LRAVGYFRKQKTTEWSSVDNSFELDFSEYCEINFHQNIGVYIDEFGSKDQYSELLSFLKDSNSEYLVVIPNAKHLGNDLEKLTRSLLEIHSTGSISLCMNENMPDPVQNAFQTLGVTGVSKTRSDRVKESMRAKAAQGKPLGRPPYGYIINEDGDLAIVREEATIVELIYRLYTKDQIGFRLIAQHLNDRGITTRKGKPWNVVTIRDVLRNVAYTGTYTRFGLRKSKVHEPIISPDIFKSAQDITKSRRPIGRVSQSEPFLLSGLIYCADCGNRMMGVTRKQKWLREDNRRSFGTYRYYQCQSRQNQGQCTYVTWRASMLESTVIGRLFEHVSNSGKDISSKEIELINMQKRVKKINKDRVKTAERRMISALRRVANAEIPLDLMSEYIKNLDGARKISNRLSSSKQMRTFKDLQEIEGLKYEDKRILLEARISDIRVHKETVEVSF
tara:strand:- start:4648 stop:5991 length:1344 start_codon:yes stop_codon:yes gene_type:complete